MEGLDPALSFTPAVAETFGPENIILVKSAQSGKPIKRWYHDWQLPGQSLKNEKYDRYDTLMTRVPQAVGTEELASVTFFGCRENGMPARAGERSA
jgi:hypothetical protein